MNSGSNRYPFTPYPKGWYQVGWSDELAPGDVHPLRYFGRDLVLFRTGGGEAIVLDAHCPHLGAHIGEGGAVVDESIRCPFHFWRFGTDGHCVDAPYERRGRVPQASLRSWPVHESSGLILVGFAADGTAPEWRMPEVPEFRALDWSGYEKQRYRIRMHVQELAENVPDRAHFLYVHETGVVPAVDYRVDGPVYRQTTALDFGEGHTIRFHQTCHGLGLIWLRNEDAAPANLFLTAPTPIDDEHVDIRVSYLFRNESSPDDTKGVLELMARQFEQDGRIWEHKVYRERPHLIDGDGPIAELRRWAVQFHGVQAS